jgi:hypothetical protein
MPCVNHMDALIIRCGKRPGNYSARGLHSFCSLVITKQPMQLPVSAMRVWFLFIVSRVFCCACAAL